VIRQTLVAGELGADAALVVTPYYNRPMQSGLLAHYNKLADATRIPLVLYNVPSRTALDMLPDTVAELARRDEIIAIKEAVPDMDRVSGFYWMPVVMMASQYSAVMTQAVWKPCDGAQRV